MSPGPWPRRVAAAVVLALVAVTIVHYLPRSRHGTAQPVRVTGTATPLPPAVSGAVSGDAEVAAEPDGITGRTLSWPGGLRLPATGERPVWFWPATGQAMPIGGLPPQRSGYQPCVARCGVQVLNLGEVGGGSPVDLGDRVGVVPQRGRAASLWPSRAAVLRRSKPPARSWLAV